MRSKFEVLAFDADDTLWHNETYFQLTQDRMEAALAPYAEASGLRARLLEAERRNIKHYGYGVKGFTLSMIETAIEITQARVPAAVIAQLVEAGRDLLDHPVTLLPGAQETLSTLAPDHHITLITKGDLLHQEQKLAQSGLGDLFDQVEIVSEKTTETYEQIFKGRASAAAMIGNSMRSDILPALSAGATGIFVPFEIEWALETADAPQNHPDFHEIPDLHGLVTLLARL